MVKEFLVPSNFEIDELGDVPTLQFTEMNGPSDWRAPKYPMNVFTTDHPMAAQPQPLWPPMTRRDAWTAYGCHVFTVALVLGVAFLAVTWVGMGIPETPDVPDPFAPPSVLELLLAGIGFVVSFPAFLIVQVDDPLGFTQKMLVSAAVIFDALFWAVAIVSLQRFLARHFLKRTVDR